MLTRGVRPFTLTYKGENVVVDLPGYYPAAQGEGVHVGDDMAAVDEALRILKEKIDRIDKISINEVRKDRDALQAALTEKQDELRDLQVDIDAGVVNNSATASGNPPTGPPVGTPTVTATVPLMPPGAPWRASP